MKNNPAMCDSLKTGGVEQSTAGEGALGESIRPGLLDREVQGLEMKPDSGLPSLGCCSIGELANMSSNSSSEDEVVLSDSSAPS